MTEYIAHRINTKTELTKLSREFGVEIDLRDTTNGRVHISHDPFQLGEDFEFYLESYHHGTMILNIKSERIEHKVLKLLSEHPNIKYFFLDSSFPMIKLLSEGGERNMALRFSEFEGMDTLKAMQGKVDWVWIDCFSRLPVDTKIYDTIKGMNYKTCLVSPELQGRPEDLVVYKEYLAEQGIIFDAICTKSYNIETWREV